MVFVELIWDHLDRCWLTGWLIFVYVLDLLWDRAKGSSKALLFFRVAIASLYLRFWLVLSLNGHIVWLWVFKLQGPCIRFYRLKRIFLLIRSFNNWRRLVMVDEIQLIFGCFKLLIETDWANPSFVWWISEIHIALLIWIGWGQNLNWSPSPFISIWRPFFRFGIFWVVKLLLQRVIMEIRGRLKGIAFHGIWLINLDLHPSHPILWWS